MKVWEAVVLGLVQGLTEFLPVSSSGHLVLLQKIFGLKDMLFFDVMVHFGTLLALVAVFWRDLLAMLKRPLAKLPVLIVVGTVPTGLMGVLFKDWFEQIFSSGKTLGVEFLITGLILWYAERARGGNRHLEDMTAADALFIGFMQGLAILPALSRSGLTISGALLRRLDRSLAARFSFLLSIPAILGAAVLETKDFLQNPAGTRDIGAVILGTVVAAVAGYAAIKFMLRLLERGNMRLFAGYVWVLGLVVIIAQLAGRF